jgi:hypothetical protein
MRKTLIASSLAALTLAGLAGGAAYATESGASPATPTSIVPGLDIFADMGLTPEQGDCLVANIGSVDINDMTALMELMTQCGISTEQLLEIGQTATESSLPAVTETSALEEAPPPAELDPVTVAAVFALLGLDQTAVDCLVAEAEAVAPADDATAEGVFVTCGVGPLQILEAIVALDAQAGVVDVPADTSTVTIAPPATVDVVGSEPTATSGNAMVDLLLEQLAAQGINLDAEQGQCLLDNLSDFDPNDMASVLAVMETCGIDVTDLLTGG